MVVDRAEYRFDNRRVVIVMPVSSREAAQYDRVLIQPPKGGLKNPSVTLPDQVRAADRARLIGQPGDLKAETLARIDRSLRIVLGLQG
jgi:mRNA-degrading endonuclease toxin of MazEF toxin-antitoxin module